MKKLAKYFKVANIDVFVYRMIAPVKADMPEVKYPLETETISGGRTAFTMTDNGKFVHRSFIYPKLHLLKLLKKSGPAIGNCVTDQAYRGQSIYPFVINRIANDFLSAKKADEVFIIVNSDNTASIRGIEKAGFELFSKIKAKRFLLFYFDKKIVRA